MTSGGRSDNSPPSGTNKCNVLGVLVDACDYDAAVTSIMGAARRRRGFAATALAVHGVMTGVRDPVQRYRLNDLDLVAPDGQPVRWALNLLHGCGLGDRVYGPDLTIRLLAEAEASALPVFFYGSTPEVLAAMTANVRRRFPSLLVAGAEPSRFKLADGKERSEIAQRILDSGARLVFVGLGCPRQETFVHDMRELLPMPMLAVGAAFDYHAGLLRAPPARLQRLGLEWAWRLMLEPGRLWRRYLLLNPAYLVRLGLQATGLWRPDPAGRPPEDRLIPV